MKVKLEGGAGRSRTERMKARRAIPVPTDSLPPKLTTGGDAEILEPAANETAAAALSPRPMTDAAIDAPEAPQPPAPQKPETPAAAPSEPTAIVEPESKPAATASREQTPERKEPTSRHNSADKTVSTGSTGAESAKVRVTIFLTDDEATLLEAQARKIGGVSPEMLLKKLVREFDPPVLDLNPAQEPELKPAAKVTRKYRADLRFAVPPEALARYRAKYDKLGLYGDGLLVRHEAIPAFKTYILGTIGKLGA